MSNTDVTSLIVTMITTDFTELIVIIAGVAGITIVIRLLLGAVSYGNDRIA